ncbi:MAG: hypothetical protein HQ508_02250 [Candidatus Marinimicrobia bacterium]|nr:hypothetical protein [Candidatus Neomarinimicrobiota bacterium]
MTQKRQLHGSRISFEVLVFVACIAIFSCASDPNSMTVKVLSDSNGHRLQVAGEDFMIFGMNWDYFPIGTNYAYNLWAQPDDIIIAALDREMSLLKDMGANTIRQYNSIPPRWVKYIYEQFGIFTTLNHPFGRYGIMVDNRWVANVDYGDLQTRKAILADVDSMVGQYQSVPGVLMWLLGNENNYGLHWNSAESQDLPGQAEPQIVQAHQLYSLLNEAINSIHTLDNQHPVAIANGDLQYIDIIAEEIKNLDIFGCNVYRGVSFGDLFDQVEQKLGIPIMLTEFGADAYNASAMIEDQKAQANYLLQNWREIYEQSSGKGKIGNAIGGLTFQFCDGWWKFGLDSNLDIHDTHASWTNGGYSEDFIHGQNNMNEEWFGICEKGASDEHGLYQLYPRAAYFTLQQIHSLNPCRPSVTLDQIEKHFSEIQL